MRLIKPDNYQPEELYLSKVADALSHPIRKRILELLLDGNIHTKAELCIHFRISKVALYNHVHVLKKSDLISFVYHVHYEEIHLNNSPLREMRCFLDKMIANS